jgi:hypothetical protein
MSAIPLAKETTFEALGKTWTLGTLSLKAWDQLREMAKSYLADPYEGLPQLIAGMDRELARELVMDAQKRKRRMLSIGSPEIREWMETLEGKLSVLYVLLKAKQPDITPETAMEIASALGAKEQAKMLSDAAGTPPPEKNALAQAA